MMGMNPPMGMGPTSQFGHLLDYMKDCGSDYSMREGMNGSMNLWSVHPVTALSYMQGMMMMEVQCQADVQGHAFRACAPLAYQLCNASFIDPGSGANASYWSDEFTPLKPGVDCVFNAATTVPGFGQNLEMPCFNWIKQTPYYMCYTDLTSAMCSGDLPSQINCLVNAVGSGMLMDDCSQALSKYPSDFMALNSSCLLNYQEAFYGLVPNPMGDPFATERPEPPWMQTDAPTSSSGSGSGNASGNMMDPAGPMTALGVVLGAGVLGLGGFLWYKKREKLGSGTSTTAPPKSGHTFDDEAAAQPTSTAGKVEVEIR